MVPDGAELSVGIFSISSFGIAPALPGSGRGSQCCWNDGGRLPVPAMLLLPRSTSHVLLASGGCDLQIWCSILIDILINLKCFCVKDTPEYCSVGWALLHSTSFYLVTVS